MQQESNSLLSHRPPPFGKALRPYFALDPSYTPLNNGSFGSPPNHVLQAKLAAQRMVESNPDLFYKLNVSTSLDAALSSVAKRLFGCADVTSLVFVGNASEGVVAALNSLKCMMGKRECGDGGETSRPSRPRKLLHLSTTYHFVLQAIAYTTATSSTYNSNNTNNNSTILQPLTIPISYPITHAALIEKVTHAIKEEQERGGEIVGAVFDAVSSVPGCVVPFRELTRLCKSHNIPVIIDAAHAAGQVSLTDLQAFDPDFLVTNLHKWFYAPRGCAVMYVSERVRGWVTSTTLTRMPDCLMREGYVEGHGSSGWRDGFHWTGTRDLSNYLSVPAACEFRDWLGGEHVIMDYCKTLARVGGAHVARMWDTWVLPTEEDACMVNVKVPADVNDKVAMTAQERLLREHRAAAQMFQHDGVWYTRFSAQVYNDESDFEAVGRMLLTVFFSQESKL